MRCSRQFYPKPGAHYRALNIIRGLYTGRFNSGIKDGVSTAYHTQKKALLQRLEKVNEKYESFVGLVDVQEAQTKVKKAEEVFLEARAEERKILREMVETREKLKQVRERLSHVDYSNPMYLQLASDQHELVNEEERQKRRLEETEDHERDSFQSLSNAMRESYEQERARVERTKNWSIIGTVIGTIVGMMGSIYMNRVRTKDLMTAVKDTGSKEELNSKLESLSETTQQNQTAVVTALNSVSENLSEMSSALQVQNLEALAGVVTNPFSGQNSIKKPVPGQSTAPRQPTIPIEALTEEIGQYNEALVALSNAVSALSNASPSSPEIDKQKVELLLVKQDKMSTLLQAKMDEVISAANRANLGNISAQLDGINDQLSRLRSAQSYTENVPVIYELPPEKDVEELNWPVGIKDVLFWGLALGGLYAFIKF